MKNDGFDEMKSLVDYGSNLAASIARLTKLFPGVASVIAWKEAIYSAQSKYQSEQSGQADLQLYVAVRWIGLAESNCLDVSNDPVKGLSIREVVGRDSEQPQPEDRAVMRKRMTKLLFKMLNVLDDGRLLQIYEFAAAFQSATGESLSSYQPDLDAVVDELSVKRYVVHQRRGVHGMSLFCRGIDFDSWAEEMTRGTPVATGNTFYFTGAVGAVQTGSHSVARVQQTIGSDHLANLKGALQAALVELAEANISKETRDEAQELIENTISEVDKPKPNRLTLGSLLGGVATAVQTLGSTSAAYQALKAALAPFGISMP